jgi:hypothetical protein
LEEGTEITLRGSGTVAANAPSARLHLAQLGDLISVGATFGSSISLQSSIWRSGSSASTATRSSSR